MRGQSIREPLVLWQIASDGYGWPFLHLTTLLIWKTEVLCWWWWVCPMLLGWQMMQMQTNNDRFRCRSKQQTTEENTHFFPKILRQIQQLRLASPPSLVAWRRLASVQQDTRVTVSRSHWNTNCRVEKEIKNKCNETSRSFCWFVFVILTKAKICPQLLWAILCVFLGCLPC